MGIIVEKYHDDRGIIWPTSVAPFQVHLVGLDLRDKNINEAAHKVCKELSAKNIEVLFDDREDATAGEKFSDADLIGIPVRLVVSKRSGDKIEYKKRNSKETKLFDIKELLKHI
jgi:prolyl-tRNA synthetase